MNAMSEIQFEQTPYKGLPWKRTSPDGAQAFARSEVTGLSYYLDFSNPERVTVHLYLCGDARPEPCEADQLRQRIGSFFVNRQLAMLAAERHDWSLQVETEALRQRELVFVGSDLIRSLVATLRNEGETDGDPDELFDLLSNDYVCPDGRSFRRAASYFEARKSALKQNANGSWAITFLADADVMPLWLSQAPLNMPCVLGAAPIREAQSEETEWHERAMHALRRAHALPEDGTFQEWLSQRYDKWGLIATATRKDSAEVCKATLETMKRLCGFASRRELTTSRDAVAALEKIDQEFYLDMARASGFVPHRRSSTT